MTELKYKLWDRRGKVLQNAYFISLYISIFFSQLTSSLWRRKKKKKTRKELKNKQAKDLGLMESLIGTALKLNSWEKKSSADLSRTSKTPPMWSIGHQAPWHILLFMTRGLQPTRLLCPWNSPGNNTEVGKPFPSPGDLPHPGVEPISQCIAGRFFIVCTTREVPKIHKRN